MKRILTAILLAALLLSAVSACAEVIPPYGMGQIGYQAVVLCQSLTVRQSASTSAKAVRTLKAGDTFAVMGYQNGWWDCYPSETEGCAGWVKADYVAVDPAWYQTDAATAVRAWNSEGAYQVALLDRGERYPVLKTEGEWLCIALRGAAGWIHDPQAAETARAAAFYPADLQYLLRADLITPDGSAHELTDFSALAELGQLLSNCHLSFASACPFDAPLTLTLADGRTVTLEMATDSCSVFRLDGDRYYYYGDNIPSVDDSSAGRGIAFWALFGLSSDSLHR